MSASFFRGTQLDQNVKFKDKDKELVKQRKWPPEFDKQVDLSKVQIDVIKAWVERRITELMGYEDEVVINFAISQIEEQQGPDNVIDPKMMTIQLTGFLEDKASTFTKELWNLLLSAQNESSGIPQELIREKLEEKQRKMEQIEHAKKQLEKIRGFTGELAQPTSTQGGISFSKAQKLKKDESESNQKSLPREGIREERKEENRKSAEKDEGKKRSRSRRRHHKRRDSRDRKSSRNESKKHNDKNRRRSYSSDENERRKPYSKEGDERKDERDRKKKKNRREKEKRKRSISSSKSSSLSAQSEPNNKDKQIVD